MREKDKLEAFIKDRLGLKGKLVVIFCLFFLWLRYSHNLGVMIKFFGIMIVISIATIIYELINYKKFIKSL